MIPHTSWRKYKICFAVRTELIVYTANINAEKHHQWALQQTEQGVVFQSSKNGVAKDSSHLGCNNVLLGEEFPTFRRMAVPSSSGWGRYYDHSKCQELLPQWCMPEDTLEEKEQSGI